MEKNGRLICSIVLNTLLIVIVTFAVLCNFVEVFSYEEGIKYSVCFRYFTVDSNILVALCALILLVCCIKKLRNSDYQIPNWVILLKYVGTIAVAITFLVTLFYLAPFAGIGKMYSKINFFLHLVAPLLAIISCLFFDSNSTISSKSSFLAIIPMAIYAVVYFVMVVIIGTNGGWEDFYGFNQNGMFVVSFIGMFLFGFALCYFFNMLRNYLINRKSSKPSD